MIRYANPNSKLTK